MNQAIVAERRKGQDSRTQQAHRAIDDVKVVMMENIGVQRQLGKLLIEMLCNLVRGVYVAGGPFFTGFTWTYQV